MNKVSILFLTIIWLYLGVAFLAPLAFHLGYNNVGVGINNFYENFCHQRVERSLYLFGEKPFYTVEELKELSAIPQTTTSNQFPEYYGHDLYGNSEIGYKVAICIRDIAMYGSLAIVSTFLYLLSKKKKINIGNTLIILLLLPMILDGLFQVFSENFLTETIPLWYINSIGKRVITGGLFGTGLAILIIRELTKVDSTT
jgi:uncharacterized membrane protein